MSGQSPRKSPAEPAEPKRGRPPRLPAPRELILSQAARLFARDGFTETSLREVAKAVGVSKAALYHYLPTKRVIFDAMVLDVLDRQFAAVAERTAVGDDSAAKLELFMKAHASFFAMNYDAFVAMMHGFGGIGRERWSSEALAKRDRYEGLLRFILLEGQRSGTLRVDDVATTARAVLSLLNWMTRWFRPDGPVPAEAMAGRYYVLIVEGLHPRDALGEAT